MSDSEPTAYRPSAILALVRAARLCTWGMPVLGLLHASQSIYLWAMMPALAVVNMVYLLAAYTLGGLVVGALLRALGDALSRGAVSPVVAQAAGVPVAAILPALPAAEEGRGRALPDIRQAIRAGKWVDAQDAIEAIAVSEGDVPVVVSLRNELQSARAVARETSLAQIEAARKVNDPDRVLDLHQLLIPLLDFDERAAQDAELSRWFLRLIHNRLRTGKIQADVAHLAGRISEAFSHTVEGASLRASLPTLRRSAGLCPRCVQPFTGVADACPACLAAAVPTPPHPRVNPPAADEDLAPPG